MGVTEPEATFSECFGGPFLVWSPMKYAHLLAEKMQRHQAKAWLVNTGWTGGGFGVGKRISLKLTRAMIDAIHAGALADAPTEPDDTLQLSAITACPGVPNEVLRPRATWKDAGAYDAAHANLARLFAQNYTKYA